MAKKAKSARKRSSVNRAKLPQKVTAVSIGVEPSEDTPTYYVNYAEVSHGPHDFCIGVTRVPTKLSAEQLTKATTEGKLVVDAVLQVVIPTSMVTGLIDALQKQVVKYEQSFGPIRKADTGGKK